MADYGLDRFLLSIVAVQNSLDCRFRFLEMFLNNFNADG